jgi:hypothetical protein
MTVLERRLLTLSVLFGVLMLVALSGGWPQSPPAVAQAASGAYYGVPDSWVAAATSDWPQSTPWWCAVANIEALANYAWEVRNGYGNYPFHAGGQFTVANDMNSSAALSRWGSPAGSTFKANISYDSGVDPRGIAWGTFYESPSRYQLVAGAAPATQPGAPPPPRRPKQSGFAYHNVIYHYSVAQNDLAVAGFARTLILFHQPVSVTINHGFHSDVVSGVYALSDPVAGFPANVDAVVAWDPAVGQSTGGYQATREALWDYYSFNTTYYIWGSLYNGNNGADPDPAVGMYRPNSTYPTHWINTLVTIEPDSHYYVSPDFAYDEHGHMMLHP